MGVLLSGQAKGRGLFLSEGEVRIAARKIKGYKWEYVVGVTVLSVIIIMVIMGSVLPESNRQNNSMATVDGTPIHVNEFRKAIQANKAQITDYFYEKYKAQPSASFWTTSYGGEIPLELLKKKALEDCVRIKVQQMIAKEQGVLTDISYEGFLKSLKVENDRRQKAIQEQKVIFGPVRYTENAYFEYVMSNAILSVTRNLAKNGWSPDEQQSKQFYEANKSQLYQAPASVKVKQVSISFLDSNRNINEELKAGAKQAMEAALTHISSGVSFEQAARQMGQSVQVTEQEYKMDNYVHVSRSPVIQAAQNLKQGEIRGVIEENGSFYIIQCLENEKSGSRDLPFNRVKDRVVNDYMDHKYKEYVHKRISDAEIVLNEEKYRKFEM